MAVAAEALPGQALEHRLELARHPRALRERADDQDEQDQDREDRNTDDARPVLALEGEGREDRVEELRAGNQRQAEREAEQDEDVAVAKRAAARDRECRKRRGQHEAADAKRGQLVGEERGCGEAEIHGERRIDALLLRLTVR